MYSGRLAPQVLAQRVRLHAAHHVRHQPPLARPSSRATTTRLAHLRVLGAARASISPGSMRKPRIFTWSSTRPGTPASPSARHRTRSPVRYIRAPGTPQNGSGTNVSAVSAGAAQVAARHAGAAHAQLAGDADGQRAERRVQHVQPLIGDRAPQRRRGRARPPHSWNGGADGGLRGAVGMDEAPSRPPPRHQLGRAGLAAGRNYRSGSGRSAHSGQRRQRRGRELAWVIRSLRICSTCSSPGRRASRRGTWSAAPEIRVANISATDESKAARPGEGAGAPAPSGRPARRRQPRCTRSRAPPAPPWAAPWSRRCTSRTPGSPAPRAASAARRSSRRCPRPRPPRTDVRAPWPRVAPRAPPS